MVATATLFRVLFIVLGGIGLIAIYGVLTSPVVLRHTGGVERGPVLEDPTRDYYNKLKNWRFRTLPLAPVTHWHGVSLPPASPEPVVLDSSSAWDEATRAAVQSARELTRARAKDIGEEIWPQSERDKPPVYPMDPQLVKYIEGMTAAADVPGMPLRMDEDRAFRDVPSALAELYARHAGDIKRAREEIKPSMEYWSEYREFSPRGMLYDLEGEILYLRLRHFRPRHVIEVGSAYGWTTMWMLMALRDNADGGVLYSFDINKFALENPNIPEALKQGRWVFTHGDAIASVTSGHFPAFDFIVVDAEHSREFQHMVGRYILDPVRNTKTLPVAVHDIYTTKLKEYSPSAEGIGLLEFMATCGRVRNAFTVSQFRDPWLVAKVQDIRQKHSLEPFSPAVSFFGNSDAMMFFEMVTDRFTVPLAPYRMNYHHLQCKIGERLCMEMHQVGVLCCPETDEMRQQDP